MEEGSSEIRLSPALFWNDLLVSVTASSTSGLRIPASHGRQLNPRVEGLVGRCGSGRGCREMGTGTGGGHGGAALVGSDTENQLPLLPPALSTHRAHCQSGAEVELRRCTKPKGNSQLK